MKDSKTKAEESTRLPCTMFPALAFFFKEKKNVNRFNRFNSEIRFAMASQPPSSAGTTKLKVRSIRFSRFCMKSDF